MLSTLTAILRVGVFGESMPPDIGKKLTADNLKSLFLLAQKHDLAHIVGDVLEKNSLLADCPEVRQLYLEQLNMATYRYKFMQYELEQLSKVLQEANIPYIPLKGSVIRGYYPLPWMRTSCDIDVLVKEEDLDRAVQCLVSSLNYRSDKKGNHDVSLYSKIGVHIELHYKLNSTSYPWDKVLDEVWDYATPQEGCRYRLKDEMFYYYHLSHMAGHFKAGGCGIRFFLDLCLLDTHLDIDKDSLTTLLDRGGLTTFNDGVVALAKCWFKEGESSKLVESMQDYLVNAGMYGDVKNYVAIEKSTKGGKKHIFSRIWLPYEKLKYQYPILQKHKILTPIYQVRRWFNLLDKSTRERAVYELGHSVNMDNAQVDKVASLMRELGI